MRIKNLILAAAVTFVSTASPLQAGDNIFSGEGAVSADELRQSRGKQALLNGISPQALLATGAAGGDAEDMKSLLAAFAASGGIGVEIYNVAPSDTTGDTLQSSGLSTATGVSSAPAGSYNANHFFPSGLANQQGFRGIIGSVRPE